MTLPPGQRLVEGFPRFGTHASRPAPQVPAEPVIEVRAPGIESFAIPLATLATLARRELTADFHCVAGWSATDLHWEGVAFETFYRRLVEPELAPGTTVSHLVLRGLDGYQVAVTLDDALADDVIVAEHLEGRPLDGDHGAPARLVSPQQYGYVNTKHLCHIEVHTSSPGNVYRSVALRLLAPHPRARVWEEERHRYLPWWSVRHVYRSLIGPLRRRIVEGEREQP